MGGGADISFLNSVGTPCRLLHATQNSPPPTPCDNAFGKPGYFVFLCKNSLPVLIHHFLHGTSIFVCSERVRVASPAPASVWANGIIRHTDPDTPACRGPQTRIGSETIDCRTEQKQCCHSATMSALHAALLYVHIADQGG